MCWLKLSQLWRASLTFVPSVAWLRRLEGVDIAGRNPEAATVSMSRELRIRAAALRTCCDPLPESCSRLFRLTSREWQRLLRWLDTSGLALYLFDRLLELQIAHLLPDDVLARLERNRIDNAERTRTMIDESGAIHRDFQRVGLSYATLKGFSLSPLSVSDPALRSQLDLDFLVAERSAPAARLILGDRGYRLHAVSGRSWEFKTPQSPGTSLKDLYKAVPYRCLELHLEADTPGRPSLLGRTEMQEFHGISMPVLSPADLFLGQGMHLYKHVFSEFLRAAHLVEFRRHVMARRGDDAFWRGVRSIAERDPAASRALGIVTLLVTQSIGEFAPQALTEWTVDRLPPTARLWVNTYGCRAALAQFPGSKLYLLLQKELANSGIPARRSLRRVLVPLKLPPAIVPTSTQENLTARLRRYCLQIHFVLFRMRFHLVEGIRYAWESSRWQKLVSQLAR